MVELASVSPWIVTDDAPGLLGFLADVLGATETGRTLRPDGSVGHAETVLGGAAVVVVDAAPGWPVTPAMLRVEVRDLDAVLDLAAAASARVVTPRTSLPFGDHVARVSDPWGNLWWLHEHVEDVEFTDLLARMGSVDTLEAMREFDHSLDVELRERGQERSTPGSDPA